MKSPLSFLLPLALLITTATGCYTMLESPADGALEPVYYQEPYAIIVPPPPYYPPPIACDRYCGVCDVCRAAVATSISYAPALERKKSREESVREHRYDPPESGIRWKSSDGDRAVEPPTRSRRNREESSKSASPIRRKKK